MKENYTVIFTSESWMFLNKYKPLSVELLEAWIMFFLIYTPAAMIVQYTGKTSIVRGLFMVLPIFLEAFLKRRISDGKVYFVLSIALIGFVWVLSPGMVEKIVNALLLGIIFLRYFIARREEHVKFWTFSVLIINGVLFAFYFVVADQMDIELIMNFITIASINNVISLLIYFHITRRDNLLAWEEEHAAALVEKMKKTSIYVIAIAAASLIMLNLALWRLGLFSMMDSLFKGISFSPTETKLTQEIVTVTQEAAVQRRPQVEVGEVSPIINLLITIVSVIIMILLAIALMYLLWALAMKLKEIWVTYFGRKELSGEKREFIFHEAPGLNIMSQINKIKKAIEDNFDFSNRRKIRSYYKRIVKRYHDKGVETLRYHTAMETMGGIEEASHRPYKEAASIYNKARYSKEECSDKDAADMKKYL